MVVLQGARAFLTRLMRRPGCVEEMNMVVVARSSGALHVWGHDFSDEGARAWLKRRLAEAEEILTK